MIMMDFKGPGFSMKIPSDWYITSTPKIQAMFISPPDEKGLTANLMITMNPVEKGSTVESIAEQTKLSQQQQYAEYQILKEGGLEFSNGQAFERKYIWFNQNKDIRVIQKQVMILVLGMFYMLTTTRPVVDQETEYIRRLDANLEFMLETFKLD